MPTLPVADAVPKVDMATVAAKLFDDETVNRDAPTANPIEGSGMGDSFKINQRLVHFIRDPDIVCVPSRRFRLNVRHLRIVDLHTDIAAIAVATLAHDQPLKPGALNQLPTQDRAVVARRAMSITGGSLEQILQEASNETRLVLGSLETGNNIPEVRAAAYRALCSGFQHGALGHMVFTQLVRRYHQTPDARCHAPSVR
eukprot:gene5043-3601_t